MELALNSANQKIIPFDTWIKSTINLGCSTCVGKVWVPKMVAYYKVDAPDAITGFQTFTFRGEVLNMKDRSRAQKKALVK